MRAPSEDMRAKGVAHTDVFTYDNAECELNIKTDSGLLSKRANMNFIINE